MVLFVQLTFYVLSYVVIILRHLAADEIYSVIVSASDNLSFDDIMCRKCKILNFNRDICSLVVCKEVVVADKGKAIGTDVIEVAVVDCSGLFDGNSTRIGHIKSWVFTAVGNLRSCADSY